MQINSLKQRFAMNGKTYIDHKHLSSWRHVDLFNLLQHIFMIKVIVLNFSAAFPSGVLSNNFHLQSNYCNNCHIKKLLWEIIGKTFSDINRTNVFLGQSPKAIEIPMKINKWGLIKLTNFCTAKTNKQKWKDNLQNGRKYLQKMWPTRA